MKSLKEKTLSSEVVFYGRFLRIWRDDVELPTGHRSFREYIKHPGAGLVVPILADGKILMVKQYRHAVGQEFYEFPAGKCDKGEKSDQTAARELTEETGYQADKITYLTRIHPCIGYSNEFIDLFVADGLIQVPHNPDPDELIELCPMTVDEIREKIFNHEISDVKTHIAFFWLERYLATKP